MMEKNSEQYIRNSFYGNSNGRSFKTNAPTQYANQQKQYMAMESKRFISERAYLATDFVVADVQGILEDFFFYVTTKIRFSDLLSPSANFNQKEEDVKQILFADPKIAYIPLGAKIRTMGNTWLVTNPSNACSVGTTAVVLRCNTSYNSYDEYGNLVKEPIRIEKASMLANDNQTKQNMVLMDGYFNVICQLNQNTAKLGQNQRIILGNMAYHITGFTNFFKEFVSDNALEEDTTRLLTFTVRIEEPTVTDDVTDDFVANGENTDFQAVMIGGVETVTIGNALQLSAALMQNTNQIIPTPQNPIGWKWSSSDPTVLSVDQNGLVTAVAEGEAVIEAVLAQNEAVKTSVAITVTSEENAPYVKFTSFSDTAITQYDSETYTAAFFENGEQTDETVEWSFEGANETDYTAEINGNTITITCNSASDIPLTLIASFGEFTASVQILLEGY